MTVPKTGRRCLLLRCWHALPSHKAWSTGVPPLGAEALASEPPARLENESDRKSAHLYWEEKKALKPGQTLICTSYFNVVSPARSFNPNTRSISWSDIEQDNRQNPPTKVELNKNIVSLANELKANHDPANSIKQFCKWIREKIVYDATVPFAGDDVEAILKTRRGHCGHMLTILQQLCLASGIKTRTITGLNLCCPSGVPNYQHLVNPQPNAHLWSEVYLPGIGWIEVEASQGEKCFEIPSGFVENNTAFQNYAVWFTEDDNIPRQALTGYSDGKLRSDYDLQHIITFTEAKY